jgi:spore coat protein U-like protein
MTTIGLLAAGQAHAGTTGTMSVTANVTGSCSIVAGNLAFGTITPSSGASPTGADTNATVNLTCTPGTGATDFEVSSGLYDQHGAGNYHLAMLNPTGTSYLPYGLDVVDTSFQSANSLIPAADAGATQDVIDATPIGSENSGGQNYTIYGEIEPGATLVAGTYSDTVTISVLY